MTFDFALEYIPRRMQELGHGNNYHLRLKHLNLSPAEVRMLEAYNQLIIIVEPAMNLKIESEMGVLDYTDINLREYQFEHSGLITIANKSQGYSNLQFIQVIPKNIFNAGDKR